MKSIRRQLIAGLIAAVIAMEVAGGVVLYAHVRGALIDALDAQIAAKAQGIATGVVVDEGNIRFHPPDSAHTSASSYYQIWDARGSLFKSPALGDGNLPRYADDDVFDLLCPNGAAGRGVELRFSPAAEDAQSVPYVRPLIIVLVEDATSVQQSLRVLLTSLLVAALATAGGIAAVVTLIVRRSLRPLNDVAHAASAIDIKSLSFRFPVDAVPPELAPICEKLNELLGRLDSAFKRERRFTSDVAHELRTPIAELRSLAEVALRWPDEMPSRVAFDDALQIAKQMETMVVTLLALARRAATRDLIEPQLIALAPIIERVWQAWQEKSAAKQIRLDLHLAPDVSVRTDPVLLNSILQNLIGNAVQYTPRGGEIRLITTGQADTATLTIENTNPGIEAADLPHLFEPFWRKDAARSGSEHSGLGLPLVSEYARILDIEVQTRLSSASLFGVTLTLPSVSEPSLEQAISGDSFAVRTTSESSTLSHITPTSK